MKEAGARALRDLDGSQDATMLAAAEPARVGGPASAAQKNPGKGG